MTAKVRRIYVEKKKGFDSEARNIYLDLKENLGIKGLTGVRVVNRYDFVGLTDEEYEKARNTIFAEPPVDCVYDEKLEFNEADSVFAMEFLPGQYDQRADSAAQCVQILTQKERPIVLSAKVIILQGQISDAELTKVKEYLINPLESREAALEKPETLEMGVELPQEVEVFEGFITKTPEELQKFLDDLELAMSLEDLKFCQTYFRDVEKRNPTMTEIKAIDTYWSDHCRHTTFFTKIDRVSIEKGVFTKPIEQAYEKYLASREFVYGDNEKDVCLMDIAVIAMKELKKRGLLQDLDESDEVNACSIVVNVDVDGVNEDWLVMFKNETHNHPTEIEPFGGAATCLGGAIRDPLSGRAYVYQAMRVTGSGDPRAKVEDTLPGKLPQRKITTGAAAGFSSYGNQVGLATGQVAEIYHEDYVAKRMEVGAVIAAAPKKNVKREKPKPGDVIILLGGRTGRDGCGGATGSSKEHTEESIFTCGAQVQKGNPPEERKIQRLFRNPKASAMIKKCNDFGAGGVAVAIGELADGLEIDLDAIPKKYEGLDGTELAISESQERMAVVLAPEKVQKFIDFASRENLEATPVAKVIAERRLRMYWRGKLIVDLSRDFLNTNGVKQRAQVVVTEPAEKENYFKNVSPAVEKELPDLRRAWLANLQDLNVCSQKGLVEIFDSTVGAGTVLMPFGGKYQATPAEGMVAKIPVLSGETTTGTIMTYGFNPKLSKWSPFHGAVYAVVEAVAKVVALGGDYKNIRLTLQEYFEKLGKDAVKWGKPFSALLGAYYAQEKLGIPAIGGKDSMSGTFKDLNVPPTLVAFAVNPVDVRTVVSQEFKKAGSKVVLVPAPRTENELPDFTALGKNYSKIHELVQAGRVLASHTVKMGGIAEAVSKMSFGNRIGMVFENFMDPKALFRPDYGSIILEIEATEDLPEIFGEVEYKVLGFTQEKAEIAIDGIEIALDEAYAAWEKPLEKIFPTKTEVIPDKPKLIEYGKKNTRKPAVKIAKPRILLPVFPGTNCEYESARAFEKAGGIVETLVFRNLTVAQVEQSLEELAKLIKNSQIIMLPGGFSAGDEPDGSGKFIATVFRNPKVKEEVMRFLKERDGLMLGICNGFQALIKLGLLPYGEIRDLTADSPTLTFNKIGRHISCMVRTKVVSTLSPWFNNVKLGDVHTVAVSHGEGRFVAGKELIAELIYNGQIATQYVDFDGNPSYDIRFNPNGSVEAVEGITSPDGRILGKMAHSERIGPNVAVNVPGEKDQKIFEAGIKYFQ
ncbi:phosphoribosylformylglycinamidine synthase [Zhaonella formicivorans]|uniref:phosphoribosylformylglycinamidine synthase n=1 Tax=Zhaonella formicivorans TaxID=2528593 RepID=UPI0010E7A411|nr:phosphoribosylformylglycinamidine synthase [Zhaonella formicivorans]